MNFTESIKQVCYNKSGVIYMKKAIPLGATNYKQLRQEDYYFVDKSMLIHEFLTRKISVSLITRPRRFGKTMNMSMMSEFFDITKDSKEIFKNTAILHTEHASKMNQYPTIFISFAEAKRNKIEIVQRIKEQLQNEYDRYQHIFINLTEFENSNYQKIKNGLLQTDDGMLGSVVNALAFLMKILEKYYHRKVMVFIDEYDTPFIEAKLGGYYDEIRNGLASMLHNALKTSTSLQYAMLTGIQKVAKENIFSDLNNLVVCTVKDPEYAPYFGFTKEETKHILHDYDLTLNEEVKSMYNGYHFDQYEMYNPWSVLNYASRKILSPYWVNTSGNEMIKLAMKQCDPSFYKDYEELIKTGKIETLVQMETSFFEVHSTASLWGLLVNAGYLTVLNIVSPIRERYILKIPNQEVGKEFQSLTSFYLKINDESLDGMFESLREGKKDQFIHHYRNILLQLPSYYDLKDENSYHMMLLGMCAWLSYEYEIISNQECGKGRCDIILKAKNENQISYLFEFKYTKNSDMDLNTFAKTAINQIKEKQYDFGLSGKVIYIGMAHYQKNVAIEWQESD